MTASEKNRIRELAKRTRELAESDANRQKRTLWADTNSLKFRRPPIFVLIPSQVIVYPEDLQCEDPLLRGMETHLLLNEYRSRMQDDYVIEPFFPISACFKPTPYEGPFGLRASLGEAEPDTAAAFNPSLLEEEDIEKILDPHYEIDEDATRALKEKCEDALDGILDVSVNRSGLQTRTWTSDLSTAVTKMRGLTQLMLDMYDRPEWLHAVLSKMQKIVLDDIDRTEKAGNFNLASFENQVSPYARELLWPSVDPTPLPASQIWAHIASQEFTIIGPELYKEFMFDYQKPIMERFGLVSYGCCEDLTTKIGMLKTVKSMRRIAVTQLANLRSCAEQLGGDYVASWRPNPSPHVCFGVDEDYVRADLRNAFEIFDANGCKFDVMMKSTQTLSGNRNALIQWVKIAREEIDRRYGL